MYVHPATDARPGEPIRNRASTGPFLLRLLWKAVWVTVTVALTAPLWPLFGLGCLVWGWPPHQSRLSMFARYLRRCARARPPAPGLPPLSRVWLALRIIGKLALVPAHGLAWHLDALIWGRRLSQPAPAPLLFLSAARSGSTQTARYLEEDPQLVAPTSLQIVFPYLWLWHLVVPTFGRLVTADALDRLIKRVTPLEMQQRHEGHPARTDTFEVLVYFNGLAILGPLFGPDVAKADTAFAGAAPENRPFWDRDFVDFLDTLGRKTVRFAARGGRPTRRLFVKGHFIEARHALTERFPDARFLTFVRDPIKRLRSVLNHLHGNPFDEVLGAIPYPWLVEWLDAEVRYCEMEQAWFCAPEGPRRTVIRFRDYVQDLEGTMRHLYRACLDQETLPPHVPRQHVRGDKKVYAVDRSLEEEGFDVAAARARLADYIAWCAGEN